jgi:hypothetical protein
VALVEVVNLVVDLVVDLVVELLQKEQVHQKMLQYPQLVLHSFAFLL